jgi:serine protease Do
MQFGATCGVLAVVAAMSGVPRAPAYAAATPMDWSSVIKQAVPAVVDISVETIATRNGVQQRERAVGTGFLVNPDGTIVTNRHVIEEAFRMLVTMSDGSQYEAKLIGAGAVVDIAVLKIDAGHPLPFLSFADSRKAEIGEPLVVIGNPLGLGTSVSSGIVSAVHRDLMNTPVDNYIQTDAAINHGNSGGPVLDREGKVLAVATILVTSGEGQGSQGLGFGIASDLASLTAKHLLDPNAAPLSWIGVHLQDVTPALKSAFHVQHLGEFLVTGIDAGSPAEQAGLLSGDVITRFGDSRPANSSELMMDIIQTPHGTRVSVSFERHGKPMQTEVTVAPWTQVDRGEAELMHTMAEAQAAETPELGVLLAPITDLARRLYNITTDKGVVVAAVDPASDAFTQGIIPGDVVEKVQDQPVTSPDQAMSVAKQAMARDRFIALLVASKNGSERWVPIYSGHRPSEEGSRALVSSTGEQKPVGEAQAGAVPQGQKP